MSKITKIQIKDFLGIEELGLEAAKINIFKGPRGSGKSSVIEAIEKTFTNNSRRTEVIKHGSDEAVLLIELDNGLEVNRRIRSEKADYLRCRKDNEAVPSTEKFLRSLINGDIFRPIDWVNMDIKAQTKSILSMLEIGWTQEDIFGWFGEIPSNVDFTQHILQILKAIELKYYKDREEVNRAIKELKTQINIITKDLPADYDGEDWRAKKVQDYYNKVSEAQKLNNWIKEAQALQENFQSKVEVIEANAESEKNKVKLRFNVQRSDTKDVIDLAKSRIEKAKDTLNNIDSNLDSALKNIDDITESKIQKAIQELKTQAEEEKEKLKKTALINKEEAKDIITLNETKIATNEQKLVGLDEVEEQELKAVDEKARSEREKEEIRVGKAAEYLKNHELIDIEPLQNEANQILEMQSFLRQWDMMLDIRDNKLASKEQYAAVLTERIEKARTLPSELLITAKMPIDGIGVDEKGFIRINGTLIDGLSDGEKLELAMRIAKEQAGELKVICLDKFESLNPAAQEKLLAEIAEDEFQYFITSTMADEFEIEKIG